MILIFRNWLILIFRSQLVHSVIKKYLLEYPAVTFSELELIFPKSIQGNLGVFDTLENANDIYSRYGYKRHFINEEDILITGNIQIAVCSQWGIGNIDSFIKLAKEKLNYKIETIK